MIAETAMSFFGPISGLSRRLFLGGAGGGLILGSALGGARSAAAQEGGSGAVSGPPPERPVGRPEPKGDLPEEPGRRLGFAVVGLGKFALQQIIPSFAQSKSTKLVALVSGNRAKAEKVAARYGVDPRGIYDYESFDRIADNPAVDVIYIILPNGLHAEFTTRAFRAGKHV